MPTYSFLVYRDTLDFYVFILCLVTLLDSLIVLLRVFLVVAGSLGPPAVVSPAAGTGVLLSPKLCAFYSLFLLLHQLELLPE